MATRGLGRPNMQNANVRTLPLLSASSVVSRDSVLDFGSNDDRIFDYPSLLNTHCQALWKRAPHFVDEQKFDTVNGVYSLCTVTLPNGNAYDARGPSKRESRQRVARKAYEHVVPRTTPLDEPVTFTHSEYFAVVSVDGDMVTIKVSRQLTEDHPDPKGPFAVLSIKKTQNATMVLTEYGAVVVRYRPNGFGRGTVTITEGDDSATRNV